MRDVYVVGVYTSKFGRYPKRTIKDLTAEAVLGALSDAELDRCELQSVFFSNSGWGMFGYQHCIRGQVALRPCGVDTIPITNVENACASGSTALHSAYKDVAAGLCDVSLAVGAEKLFWPNKFAVFAGFLAGTDVEEITAAAARMAAQTQRAPVPKVTAAARELTKVRGKRSRSYRQRFTTLRDMAAVGVVLGESMGYDRLKELVALSRSGASSGGGAKGDHSPFMDVYAYKAREHMQRYGSTPQQLAAIASKNHQHSTLNERAQYTFALSPEEVLADRMVASPLTRAMCAPIGDGAAAAIVMSQRAAERFGLLARAIKIRTSVLGSGRKRDATEPDISERLAAQAYAQSGLGPEAVDVAELHDATAFGELHQSEALGFFAKGEGGIAAERGETRIGGRLPINPSGGLLSRGHPIGASGLAQIHELVTQLRGEAGPRQVEGARIALAENGGGALGDEEAAMCIHILERVS